MLFSDKYLYIFGYKYLSIFYQVRNKFFVPRTSILLKMSKSSNLTHFNMIKKNASITQIKLLFIISKLIINVL